MAEDERLYDFYDELKKVDSAFAKKYKKYLEDSDDNILPPQRIIRDKKTNKTKLVPISPLKTYAQFVKYPDSYNAFLAPHLGLWIFDKKEVPLAIRNVLERTPESPDDELADALEFLEQLQEDARNNKEMQRSIVADFPTFLMKMAKELDSIKISEFKESKSTQKSGKLSVSLKKKVVSKTQVVNVTSVEQAEQELDNADTDVNSERFQAILDSTDIYNVTHTNQKLTNIVKMKQTTTTNFLIVPDTRNLYVNIESYRKDEAPGVYYISAALGIGNELVDKLDNLISQTVGGARRRTKRRKRRTKREPVKQPSQEQEVSEATDDISEEGQTEDVYDDI